MDWEEVDSSAPIIVGFSDVEVVSAGSNHAIRDPNKEINSSASGQQETDRSCGSGSDDGDCDSEADTVVLQGADKCCDTLNISESEREDSGNDSEDDNGDCSSMLLLEHFENEAKVRKLEPKSATEMILVWFKSNVGAESLMCAILREGITCEADLVALLKQKLLRSDNYRLSFMDLDEFVRVTAKFFLPKMSEL